MSMLSTEAMREFVQEAREHLASIEPDLLEIERQGGEVQREALDRIFRAIHSVKGGASFLAFGQLSKLSHAMEHALAELRDGLVGVDSGVVDVLLRGVDILRCMLDDIDHSDDVPCHRELAELAQLLKTAKKAPSPEYIAVESTASPDVRTLLTTFRVEPQELAQSLARGMKLYRVTLTSELRASGTTPETVTSKIASIGTVLGSDATPASEDLSILCASVVDREMFLHELGLGNESILQLDTASVKRELNETLARGADEGSEPRPMPAPKEQGPAAQQSLRVKLGALNRLMNVGGELVLARNQLLRALDGSADGVPGLPEILQNIDRLTFELQESIMQTRMQPVEALFARYQRMVRDLARQTDKRVSLEIRGAEVELDRSIVEALVDPLTHIIRNSVSHGIESPAERQAAGKALSGQITLAAFHGSGHVTIVVSDDGRGVNLRKLLKRAVEQGRLDRAGGAQLSEQEILDLALEPGFSTAEQISDISGRGVGLDVVRTNVQRLGGQVRLKTEFGAGTTVTLELPLTMAIIPALIVGAGSARFVVPQASILELVWVQGAHASERLEEVDGAPVLRLRGRLLPLVALFDVLDMLRGSDESEAVRVADVREVDGGTASERGAARGRAWTDDRCVVVLRAGAHRFGLVVDELFDNEEIVIKPLPVHVEQIDCFAGTTILGDGRVTMILDPDGIAKKARLAFQQAPTTTERSSRAGAAEPTPVNSHSIILVDAAPGEQLAVPQATIWRVERIAPNEIRCLGRREYVQYRSGGLNLVRLDQHFPVSAVPDDATELFLLLPKASHSGETLRMGVLVWRVVDARDVSVEIQPPLFDAPGMVGSGMVDGNLTLFFDPMQLVAAASSPATARVAQ